MPTARKLVNRLIHPPPAPTIPSAPRPPGTPTYYPLPALHVTDDELDVITRLHAITGLGSPAGLLQHALVKLALFHGVDLPAGAFALGRLKGTR